MCRLYAKYSRDEVSTSVLPHSEQTIASTVVDGLGAGDTVRLGCADYLGGSSYLSWVKITAIKVGELTNTHVGLPSGYPVIN